MKEHQVSEERVSLQQVVTGAKERVRSKLDDIWWWFLVRGVLAIGFACFAIFWPEKTLGILVKLLGGYMFFDGVVGAIGAVRSGGQRRLPVFSIVSIVVGSILLFWTGLSVRLFLSLVGAWAFLQGVGLYWSNRIPDSDAETRQMFGSVGAVIAAIGLILVVWPSTGVVAISWLMAAVGLVIGCVMIFIAIWLRRCSERFGTVTDKVRQA